MKKISHTLITQLFCFCFIINLNAQSSCNAGNESLSLPVSATFGGNVLLGVRYNVPANGILNSLNLWGLGTNVSVKMVLYNDNLGVPGNFFISSSIGTVTNGIVSLPVTPTFIPAGNYWLMAIYDTTGLHSNHITTGTNPVYYQSLTFGSPIPNNGSGFLSYCCREFQYWMEISCNTGVDKLDFISNLKLFPNPTSDFINIDFGASSFKGSIDLINILGQTILHKDLSKTIGNLEAIQINLLDQPNGIYFVKFNTEQWVHTEKIVLCK